MRSRQLAWVLLCLSTVYGCGGTSTRNSDSSTDVPKDTPADKTPDAGSDADTKLDLASDTKDAPDAPDVPKDGLDGGGDVDIGGPPPCKTASECPGQDSECAHRTCVAGACGTANETLGKILATQIIGDCKVRQCAANGTATTVIDDRDIPDDINPCTRDTCTGGVSAHAPVAKDTACGGGKLCNATGQCIGCTIAEQCPGTDNACRTRTCVQQICGVTFVAAGMKLTDPTSGDCKGLQCDGQGIIQTVAIATDVPADNNACTQDQCNGTTPTHQPVARNTSCGTGLVCDGTSRCVACLTAATCPGVDNECQNRTCSNGACGTSYAAAGKAVAGQTSGDCKRQQCNGSGAVVTVNDDSDPLVDNNPCSRDVCTAGVPSNPPLAIRTNCGPNLQCDGNGLCVGCLAVSDCPGTDTVCRFRTCTDGRCGIGLAAPGTPAAEQTAGDCKQNQCDGKGAVVVVSDNDPQNDNNPCTDDVCTAGANSHPFKPIKTSCGPAPLECDAAGHCVNCVSNAECGNDTECIKNTCEAGSCKQTFIVGQAGAVQTPNNCKRSQCDSAGNLIDVPDDTDPPVDMFECTLNVCTAGVPTNPPVPAMTACTQAGGMLCNGMGSCVACISAAQCPASTDCRKYACTLGMCVFTDEPAEKPLPAEKQMDGDCQELVCTGAGSTKSIAKNDDPPPIDNNECTNDLCTAGVPSHPVVPNRTCETNKVCKSDGTCVECITDVQCGSLGNTECLVHTCVSNICVHTPHPGPMTAQTSKDCKINVCNAAGQEELGQPDDTDKPIDGNLCTADICTNGVPSNPAEPPDTSCGTNGKCDGAGLCNNCGDDAECGVSDDCVTHACLPGVNGVKSCVTTNAAMGKVVTLQMPGDCKKSVCNGDGVAAPIVDLGDIPDDSNACTNDICTQDVPSHTNKTQGDLCTQPGGPGMVCNASGVCVGCNTAADCGTNTADGCKVFTCTAGFCGRADPGNGTLALTGQTAQDCKKKVCNGSGEVITDDDNADVVTDGNSCTKDLCSNGVPTNPNEAVGSSCSQNAGTHCDAATPSHCVPSFMVVRVGSDMSVTALSAAAAPVFIEELNISDASLVRTITLPSTAGEVSGTQKPFTLAGTGPTEGALVLSANGKFVTLAGYSAVASTASVATSAALTVPRSIARIDALGNKDTSTTTGITAFNTNAVRGAASDDGGQFWVAGNASGTGNATRKGVFYAASLGATSNAFQIVLDKSTRACQVVLISSSPPTKQLFCAGASTGFSKICSVGLPNGLPTNTMETPAPLPGMTADAEPFGFAFTNRDSMGVPQTIYVADARAIGQGGGVQKWTLANGTWTMSGTIIGNLSDGVRGLAAYESGTTTVLIATTATAVDGAPNAIVSMIDAGGAVETVNATVLKTSGAITPTTAQFIYRGVSLPPN